MQRGEESKEIVIVGIVPKHVPKEVPERRGNQIQHSCEDSANSRGLPAPSLLSNVPRDDPAIFQLVSIPGPERNELIKREDIRATLPSSFPSSQVSYRDFPTKFRYRNEYGWLVHRQLLILSLFQ